MKGPLFGRILRYARNRLGFPPPIVEGRLGSLEVTVREGLIPPRPDKDDGWMAAAILDSKVFLDVGCNVGLWSLYACMTSKRREVIAWDTNALALTRCFENLLLNSCADQTRFVFGFASDSDEAPVQFFTVGAGAAGSRFRGHATTAAEQGRSTEVMSRSIDSVVETRGLTPDLIKLDVEGAEAEALRGATRTATRYGPRFLVEVHSPPELPMRENASRILAWCDSVGYSAHYLKEHARLLYATGIEHRGRCHLLLSRSTDAYPNWLATIPENSDLATGESAYNKWLGR